MKDKYLYYTHLGNTRRPCFPINVREVKLDYKFSDDDRRFSFEEDFSGELLFTNDSGDFDYLFSIEKSGNKCRAIGLEIERLCGSDYSIWKKATLRLVDGQWDLDSCTVAIKPVIQNEYSCYKENAEKEVNLLDLPLKKITVDYLKGTIEKMQYDADGYELDFAEHFGGVNPASLGWRCYKWIRHTGQIGPPTFTFFYGREVLTIPADQNPGTEWILLEDLGATKKWARLPLLLYDWQNTADLEPAFGDQYGLNFVIFGDVDPGAWDNGMLLNDVLSYFVSNYCGLKVVSNFFQINATATFSATYPLFKDGLTFHHVVWQKSDVKRPNDFNNATKAPYTFKKLLVGVCTMHNLWWRIEEGVFRIEHVSFWQRLITYDATAQPAKTRLVRSRQYKYETQKLPRLETFKYMEDGSADFVGKSIEYVGDCVSDEEGQREKSLPVEGITTDIELCMNNADSRSSKVSDAGLVIMATKIEDDGKYYPFRLTPILEKDSHINNSLGWAFLLSEYHRHERLQLNGYINGVYQNFLSTKATKKRNRVGITFCCDDAIDLTGLVVTDMGQAIIGEASFLPYQDELELDLLYPDEIGNVACLRPKVFRFHHFDKDLQAFFFDTQFEVPGNYQTEIEAVNPDGATQYFAINPDTDGIYPATFPPYIEGVWKFRKRIICDVDFIGPWTDYISVDTAQLQGGSNESVCAGQPMEQPDYISFSGTKFTFRDTVDVRAVVQCEITRPDGRVYFGTVDYITRIRSKLEFTVDLNLSQQEYARWVILGPTHGLYRFRFRKLCDAQNGIYSDFSNYVDLNL